MVKSIYVRKDAVIERKLTSSKADLGDFSASKVKLARTDMGGTFYQGYSYAHLSKALRPLPEKFHGLSDVETIYRKRYLDLISNRENFDNITFKIISEIRHFYRCSRRVFLKSKHCSSQ